MGRTVTTSVRVKRESLVSLWVTGGFFTLALLAATLGPLLLALAAPALTAVGGYARPPAFALVHLYALGVGTMTALGALQQLAAVLFAASPPPARLGLAGLILYALGVGGLVSGFWSFQTALLVAGGTLAILGVGVSLFGVVRTIRQGTQVTPPRPFLLSAMVYLLLTVLLGLTMAAGLAGLPLPVSFRQLFGLHLVLGGLGWFGCLIAGVSYWLIPFFGLARSPRGGRHASLVLALLHGSVVAGVALVLAGQSLWPALALHALGWLIHSWENRDLYRPAIRPLPAGLLWWVRAAQLDLALVTVGAGLLSLSPLARWLGQHLSLAGLATAVGGLALAGWVTANVIGYLHRILPFLVWHTVNWERARSGAPTPLFSKMVNQTLGGLSAAPYQAGLLGVCAALLWPDRLGAWLLPASAALMALGVGPAAAQLIAVFWRVRAPVSAPPGEPGRASQ